MSSYDWLRFVPCFCSHLLTMVTDCVMQSVTWE